MLLKDLLDLNVLDGEILDKNVRQSSDGWYTIFNYTDQCMRDKHWNDVTTKTRGLVVSTVWPTAVVVARPWDKFFNYGEIEHQIGHRLKEPVEVTDKYDGSLGIAFTGEFDRPRIATRGSLTSDQAKHAQTILDIKYPDFFVKPGWTMFFEIVYPENRIVLDYEGLDDLIYLGARNLESGELAGPTDTRFKWHGPRAHTFTYSTLGRALAAPPRPNSEGMVIRFLADDLMVKIKQEDYVALHRIVTGLSRKTVWQFLFDAGNLWPAEAEQKFIAGLPEEFADWVLETHQQIALQCDEIIGQTNTDIAKAVVRLGTSFSRKDFAGYAKTCKYPDLMFLWADGKNTFEAMMKKIKPVGETARFSRSEDVA